MIVSAPGALDTFIRFDPILPADRAQLQQRVPQGTVWKIWLVYDRAFWRDQGLSGDTISIQPGDFIPNSRDSGPPAEQRMPGLMVCFVVGPRASIFNARGAALAHDPLSRRPGATAEITARSMGRGPTLARAY